MITPKWITVLTPIFHALLNIMSVRQCVSELFALLSLDEISRGGRKHDSRLSRQDQQDSKIPSILHFNRIYANSKLTVTVQNSAQPAVAVPGFF